MTGTSSPRRVTAAERDTWIRWYRAGLKRREIIRLSGRPPSTVSYVLRRAAREGAIIGRLQKLSPLERAVIKEMYRSGAPLKEIYRRTGRHFMTVWSCIKKAVAAGEVPQRAPRDPWSPAEIAQLADLLSEGKPYSEIALILGRSRRACIGKKTRWLDRGKPVPRIHERGDYTADKNRQIQKEIDDIRARARAYFPRERPTRY